MNCEDVETTLAKINQYLRSKPWMDFEVMEYRGTCLTVMGSIDTSAPHCLEISFEEVSFISLPTEWRTDTSTNPLELLTGAAAAEVNRRFRTERGHQVFSFRAEDHPSDTGCLLGAKRIGYRTL